MELRHERQASSQRMDTMWKGYDMDMFSPDYQKFMRMWFDFISKTVSAGAAVSTESFPGDAARQMRDMFFQALSQYSEQFMRSPEFLEIVRRSTDNAVAVRQQTNDFLADAHRATGSLARPDMDSLLMAIRRTETRILDKLDELSSRVAILESEAKTVASTNGKRVRTSK